MDIRIRLKKITDIKSLSVTMNEEALLIFSGDNSLEIQGPKQLRYLAAWRLMKQLVELVGEKIASELTEEEARCLYRETSW